MTDSTLAPIVEKNTAHLARILQALESYKEREYYTEHARTENKSAELCRALCAFLQAEINALKTGEMQAEIPINGLTGFPSTPSFAADLERIARQNLSISELLEEREISARCPHCICPPRNKLAFVPIISYERLVMREEESWFVLEYVLRIACDDEVYIQNHNDPELAQGLERAADSFRCHWLWEENRLEVAA